VFQLINKFRNIDEKMKDSSLVRTIREIVRGKVQLDLSNLDESNMEALLKYLRRLDEINLNKSEDRLQFSSHQSNTNINSRNHGHYQNRSNAYRS